MPAKKKTPYMELVEADKRTIEKNRLEEEQRKITMEQEKNRAELRKQLISDYDKKVKITGEAKLDFDKEVKPCTSVVLKPLESKEKYVRKAVNGVYCLGKRMVNN